MKTIKNNGKKLLSITALAALTLCGVTQGMAPPLVTQTIVPHISQINESNIAIIPSDSISEIINEQTQIIAADENPEMLIKNTSRISRAKIIARAITKHNIKKINPWTIKFIIEANATLAKTFATCITKDNIQQINYLTIKSILYADQALAQTFASYITKDNLPQVAPYTIECILEADKTLAKTFASCITKDNFDYVTQDKHYKPIIPYILAADTNLAKTLAQFITKDNLQKIDLSLFLQADPAVAKIIATNCVTKENYSSLPLDTKILLNILPNTPNGFSKSYLFDPQKFTKFINEKGPHLGTRETNQCFSDQHLGANYNRINNFFSCALQKDPNLRGTLCEIVDREAKEQANGRYTIYHSRKSTSRFVDDLIFRELLQLFYKKPIDTASWHTLHRKLPGEYLPYKKVKNIITTGRSVMDNDCTDTFRDNMQFCANVLSPNWGASPLDFAIDNRNVGGNYISSNTTKELFIKFKMETYYQCGLDKFNAAKKLANQFKYGTLLQYSITPEALKTFTFASKEGYGVKEPIVIDGTTKTDSIQKTLDTLATAPTKLDKDSQNCEYVIIICDDHPTNTTKLGSANPFNLDIRCYAHNLGNDKKIAAQIKLLVAQAFDKIRTAMVKDEAITQELADELRQTNDLLKPKSKL